MSGASVKRFDATSQSDRKVTVGIAAPEGALAWTIYGPCDMLSAAGPDWHLVRGADGSPVFDVSIVGATMDPVRCFQGKRICPDTTIERLDRPDVLIVPSLANLADDSLSSANARAFAEWVFRSHRGGSLICSISTGAALLAEAGLLRGARAATHWAYCDRLARRYPNVRFIANHRILVDRRSNQIITVAEGTAWQDLVTHLVGRYADVRWAQQLQKTCGVRPTRGGVISEFVPCRDHGDSLILQAQDTLASGFFKSSALAIATRVSGLSERTFQRRFERATGLLPSRYLRHLRIAEAKLHLELGSDRIDEIAERVGYADIPSFRRTFRSVTGQSPAEYRDQHRQTSIPSDRIQ